MSKTTVTKQISRPGRQGGRTAFQEEKRQKTRADILAAAAEVFSSASYPYVTIDHIIKAASVSRATFYMHFESKLALALTIYDGIVADWMELFDQLAAMPAYEAGVLESWVKKMATLYIDHGYITSLVFQLEVFEPDFRQRLWQDRDALISRLGEAGAGGFSEALGESDENQLHRARAHLLLRRLDDVSNDLALSSANDSTQARFYVSLIVQELLDFINS